jgi:hypothetical protein
MMDGRRYTGHLTELLERSRCVKKVDVGRAVYNETLAHPARYAIVASSGISEQLSSTESAAIEQS